MSNFLSDLYRYRQRPSRNSKEDFITEVFKHLLQELDREGRSGFVLRELLNINGGVLTPRIKWQSQFTLESSSIAHGKRPDLVGEGRYEESDESFLIFIENKISAGFTAHRATNKNETGEEWIDQLSIYASHLQAQTTYEYRYLVLITHETDPPDKFSGIQIRWRQIHLRLKQWVTRHELKSFPKAEFIAESLLTLLEDWNMNSIDLNLNDIAGLDSFMRLYEASVEFSEIARKAISPLLVQGAYWWLGNHKRIGWAGARLDGISRPNFFGHVFSACDDSGKPQPVNDNSLVIWAGALLGECYDAIKPRYLGLPELSVGIAAWYTLDKFHPQGDEKLDSILKKLSKSTSSKKWEQQNLESLWLKEKLLHESNKNTGILIISASLSYLEGFQLLRQENRDGIVDWADLAHRFFRDHFQAITELSDDDIDFIADCFEQKNP